MIRVRVNGETRRMEASVTVADLVRDLVGDASRSGIAVALNRAVVTRARWTETGLADGDDVEIVVPFEGG